MRAFTSTNLTIAVLGVDFRGGAGDRTEHDRSRSTHG